MILDTTKRTPSAALPIPSLDQTISRYLERIQPLLSEEKYAAGKTVAENFLKNSGALLHAQLLEYGASLEEGSWLKPIWDEAFLGYREPINGTMNYSTVLDTEQIPKGNSFAEFCARLVFAMVNTHQEIASGAQEKDIGPSGHLCMEQYDNVFGACRIPRPEKDEFFSGGGRLKDASVVVLHGGNIYLLPVVKDNKTVGVSSLALGIGEILGRKDSPAPNIGIMTTAPRESAAKLRNHITALDARNEENFKKIESALFALCIDGEPQKERTEHQLIRDVLHGNGKDRWFDKSMQAIVGADYSIGFNNEHTGFDGAIWINIQWNT